MAIFPAQQDHIYEYVKKTAEEVRSAYRIQNSALAPSRPLYLSYLSFTCTTVYHIVVSSYRR